MTTSLSCAYDISLSSFDVYTNYTALEAICPMVLQLDIFKKKVIVSFYISDIIAFAFDILLNIHQHLCCICIKQWYKPM